MRRTRPGRRRRRRRSTPRRDPGPGVSTTDPLSMPTGGRNSTAIRPGWSMSPVRSRPVPGEVPGPSAGVGSLAPVHGDRDVLVLDPHGLGPRTPPGRPSTTSATGPSQGSTSGARRSSAVLDPLEPVGAEQPHRRARRGQALGQERHRAARDHRHHGEAPGQGGQHAGRLGQRVGRWRGPPRWAPASRRSRSGRHWPRAARAAPPAGPGRRRPPSPCRRRAGPVDPSSPTGASRPVRGRAPVEVVVDPGANRARSGPATTTTLAPAVLAPGRPRVVGWMVLAGNPSALVTVVAALGGPRHRVHLGRRSPWWWRWWRAGSEIPATGDRWRCPRRGR